MPGAGNALAVSDRDAGRWPSCDAGFYTVLRCGIAVQAGALSCVPAYSRL